MIKNTYKSLFKKIEPSDDLIKLTKQKMKQEQSKKHFSFYKFSAIAACFIIVIVITIPYTKNTESISHDAAEFNNNSFGSITGSASDLTIEESFDKPNFSGQNSLKSELFATSDSVTSDSINSVGKTSIIDTIINFIKKIISLLLNF